MSDVTKSEAEPTDGRSDGREQTRAESGLEHSSRVDLPSIELPEEVEGNDTFEAEQPPPLPPRPGRANLLRRTSSVAPAAFPSTQASARPRLQATATTAVSRTDIHTQSFQDGSRETSTTSTQRSPPTRAWTGWGSIRRLKIHDGDESASIRSYAPTLEAAGDAESLLGDVLGSEQTSGWHILSKQLVGTVFQLADAPDDEEILHDFDHEFEEVDSLDSSADNEGELSIRDFG